MPLNIQINYHNFPPNEQAAVQRAVNTWQNTLDSAVPVQVEAYWGVVIGLNLNAMNVPNGSENFPNAPLANTWYTSALADKLAGQDVQPNQADMAVCFDANFNWYTGQGNPQQNQYDLESIALHELCHGFGFVSLFWVQGQQPPIGSYGNNALLNVIPPNVIQLLPFVLPNLNMHPSVYGTHIEDQNGGHLTDQNHYANPSAPLGAALIGGNLFFDQNHDQVYAPNPFIPFTSIDHLDPNVFPNSLMRPSIGAGQVVRQVDAPVQNILTALGW